MILREDGYKFITVIGIPFDLLVSIPNSFVIGPGCDGSFGMIPAGISLDELFETLQELETTIEQRTNQANRRGQNPSCSSLGADNVESSRGLGAAQFGIEDSHNIGGRGINGLHKMDAANSIKRVRDTQRRMAQLSKMRELLFDNPNIGTAELAKALGVSKQTIRNLRDDLSGQLFSRSTGDMTPATQTNGENYNEYQS